MWSTFQSNQDVLKSLISFFKSEYFLWFIFRGNCLKSPQYEFLFPDTKFAHIALGNSKIRMISFFSWDLPMIGYLTIVALDFWARIGFSLRAPSREYLSSVFASTVDAASYYFLCHLPKPSVFALLQILQAIIFCAICLSSELTSEE